MYDNYYVPFGFSFKLCFFMFSHSLSSLSLILQNNNKQQCIIQYENILFYHDGNSILLTLISWRGTKRQVVTLRKRFQHFRRPLEEFGILQLLFAEFLERSKSGVTRWIVKIIWIAFHPNTEDSFHRSVTKQQIRTTSNHLNTQKS